MKIGYLGPKGSYTYIAASKAFASNVDSLQAVKSISDLIEDLDKAKLDKIIVPVENSIQGGVTETIDRLLETDNVYVNEEIIVSIKHCLLVKENIELSAISHIFAHPMSFAQCRNYLRSHLFNAQHKEMPSNSAAAAFVAGAEKVHGYFGVDESNPNVEDIYAAIGSEINADIYGLKILAQEINDEQSNSTRFWILSNRPSPQSAEAKTTIVFRVKDDKGSLVNILQYFAEANINLSRIESRPSRRVLGEYTFCLDFNVHKEDLAFNEVLQKVRRYFTFYKCLGSYSLIS